MTTTIPTLETLADKASARGELLGAQDSLGGIYMNEADAPKCISDLILLYMVFLDDEGTDSDIYTDYIMSEFLLGYALGFTNGKVN